MQNIIEVSNLTKDYGYGRGVFQITFSIPKGEVFGFLGPNGAGKSTTIRHLMGFSKPHEGTTKILGQDTFQNYDKILKNIGYIPGELALPVGLSGKEFIKMTQDLVGVYNDERLNYLCSIFKLDDDILKMKTKQMSLGIKRKLAIVNTFMTDPDILILDEPTSGLDPFMQDEFIKLIKQEKERGKTIMLSSHLFNEVEQTCDRVSIIKDGKIASTFYTNDLKHDKNKIYSLNFQVKEEYTNFIQNIKYKDFLSVISFNDQKNEVLISTHDSQISLVIDYLSKYKLTEFINQKETLQEYFLKFYQEDKDFGGL